ncbi:hypothetical protein KGV55_01770 [Candidatus Gracilibacteria bacterium]|nr:hypothetical protein [Candidatus Gracilibacteria bacterium]
MFIEAYHVKDKNELIEKAQENGGFKDAKAVQEKLQKMEVENVGEIKMALKNLSKNLSDETVYALENEGVTKTSELRVSNNKWLNFSQSVDLSKIYTYVYGRVENNQYDMETVEKIGKLLFDNFKLPNKQEK